LLFFHFMILLRGAYIKEAGNEVQGWFGLVPHSGVVVVVTVSTIGNGKVTNEGGRKDE
jgi:hypothetical protein